MKFMQDPAALLALLVAAGIATQILAARLRTPAILPLLVVGLVLGPLTGLLDPDALFGDLLFPGVSLAVAVILFEGALTLRFAEIKGAGSIVFRLITLGVMVSVVTIAATARWLLDFDWQMALLFGALASVSGPTVVVPLLRTMRPSARVANVLRWEGILIDAIGAMLAVIVFEAILAGFDGESDPLLGLLLLLGSGSLIGAAGGFGLATLMRRHLLPDYLRNVTTLATVLLTFVLANSLAHEGGLVAVTAMGLVLANAKGISRDQILDFKESLSVLLISVLFIVLAARIDIAELQLLGWPIVLILLVILFVARPLSALVATLGSAMPWRERVLIGWIMPRGIIAAAISALFALRLEAEGIAGAELLVPLIFAVIVTTVVLHSLTGRPLARLLGAAQPDVGGVLIVGGNLVAFNIAMRLKDCGVNVLLADADYNQTRRARMAGIPVFYGSAVSEQADRKLDLVGLDMLLALSRNPALNALACLRYAHEFGSGNVYTVRRKEDFQDREKETATFDSRGRLLFKPEMTLDRLEAAFEDGKRVRLASITADFEFSHLVDRLGSTEEMLFAITPESGVHPFVENSSFRVGPGWRVAYVGEAEREKPAAKDETNPK